ncbi:MAG: hypothetical protein ACNS60_17335 [Candidatus Cyclobacteriaceae bacterium M2_1C_046]
MRLLILFISLLITCSCTAIRYPKDIAQQRKKCRAINARSINQVGVAIYDLPAGVVVTLHPEEEAERIFNNSRDGLFLEVVERGQYACDTTSENVRGLYLPPLYKKEIFNNKTPHALLPGAFTFNAGVLPDELQGYDYEINVVYLQKRFVCIKGTMPNVFSEQLEILETGLFPIELTQDSLKKIAEKGVTSEFVLHYEQGRSNISNKQLEMFLNEIRDIKNIQKFTVTGYASVEGSRKTNRIIFTDRTQKIRKVLEKDFPGIPIRFSSDENWDDFLIDIQDTPYRFLASRNKSTIKKLMDERSLYDTLEYLLEGHRKVVVEVNSKIITEESTPEEIKHEFQSAYQEADLARLLFIHKKVMDRIKEFKLPKEFLNELEVPAQSIYGPLLLNHLISQYQLNTTSLDETLHAMEELYRLMPREPYIMYNLTALKLMEMVIRPAEVDEKEISRLMHLINKVELEDRLRQRLKINHAMIQIGYDYAAGKKKKVRKWLFQIKKLYPAARYEEKELLRLANFYENYGDDAYAEKILYPIVKQGTGNEEVIFYYLSLTLGNTKFNTHNWYHELMYQAYNMNPERYCKLFDNRNNGGISFQLLEYPEVKERYCGWCVD